jgi:predicted aldo/keto reductase-like oxidoreductase
MNILLVSPKVNFTTKNQALMSFWINSNETSAYRELWSGVGSSLLTIAALTPDEHSVEFIDENIAEIDFEKTFDIVGISAMTQQIMRGYQIADIFRSKGIPVVVMEPLRGGNLAKNVSEDIKAAWNKAETKRSHIDWAFRWVCNFPEVAVVLSGINTMEQLNENIKTFETALPGSMTLEELDLVHEVQALYKNKIKVGCTQCNYCSGCPSGISIPRIFEVWNHASMFETWGEDSARYGRLKTAGKSADKCVQCGNCESLCPQHIKIIDKLQEAAAALSSNVKG